MEKSSTTRFKLFQSGTGQSARIAHQRLRQDLGQRNQTHTGSAAVARQRLRHDLQHPGLSGRFGEHATNVSSRHTDAAASLALLHTLLAQDIRAEV